MIVSFLKKFNFMRRYPDGEFADPWALAYI